MNTQPSVSEKFHPGGQEPVFDEPWMARAFALTVRLHQQGVFGWPQWSRYLAEAIASNGADGDASYYENWLQALETLLRDSGILDWETYLDEIGRLQDSAAQSVQPQYRS